MLVPLLAATAAAAPPPSSCTGCDNVYDVDYSTGDATTIAPNATSTQVKFLGLSPSAAECRARCAAFRYRAQPCRSWTHWGASAADARMRRQCFGRIDDVWAPRRDQDGAIMSGSLGLPDCQSAVECELNGDCTGGRCRCNQGWRGPHCSTLDLAPVDREKFGYSPPNVSSWGASIAKEETGRSYHMFVNHMSESCGLDTWDTNSVIMRAVSSDPAGPYLATEVVRPAEASEPALTKAPDGRWVLYHVAKPAPSPPDPPTDGPATQSPRCAGGVTLALGDRSGTKTPFETRFITATALEGPWVNDTTVGVDDENPGDSSHRR